ncbi:hypothetical protein ACP70R_041347 [Stipagrostis hirtigluma subsp. patula]
MEGEIQPHQHVADVDHEFQDMKLVVRTSKGTIEIPLKGNMILQNSGQPPHQAVAGGADTAKEPVAEKSKEDNASLEKEKKEKKEEDQEYMNEMRGWMVTAATLFVGIAFQAAMQPPAWMAKTEEWSRTVGHKDRLRALSRDERKVILRTLIYHSLNAMMFSAALTLVVILLMMDKSSHTSVLWSVRLLFPLISFCVATNFIVGVTNYGASTALFSFITAIYALPLAWFLAIPSFLRWYHQRKQEARKHKARSDESGTSTTHQRLAEQAQPQV